MAYLRILGHLVFAAITVLLLDSGVGIGGGGAVVDSVGSCFLAVLAAAVILPLFGLQVFPQGSGSPLAQGLADLPVDLGEAAGAAFLGALRDFCKNNRFTLKYSIYKTKPGTT